MSQRLQGKVALVVGAGSIGAAISNGAACALLFERTGEPYFKDQAYRFLNCATYMTAADGFVAVGPNWPGAWWSDGYTDYVRHYLDALGAVPEWAPAGENHLLRSTAVVQEISYSAAAIALTAYEDGTDLVFRLTQPPAAVLAGEQPLARMEKAADAAYTWTPLGPGGVLRIQRLPGKACRIKLQP